MIPLTVAIVSALLTAGVGNWLVQRWQQRNWFTQHKLQKAEKKLDELRKLTDELLRLGNARTFRMQRVVKNLASANNTFFEVIKKDYETALVKWNDRFNSLGVGLRLYADYHYTDRLDGIQRDFVNVNEELDRAIRERGSAASSATRARLERKLNGISGLLFDIGRDLTGLLIQRQDEAYEGKWIEFSPATLDLFPWWYLLKALFQPTYPRKAVRSSALDLSRPFVRRP